MRNLVFPMALIACTTIGANAMESELKKSKPVKSVTFKSELTQTCYFEAEAPEPKIPPFSQSTNLPNLNEKILKKLTYKGEDLKEKWQKIQCIFNTYFNLSENGYDRIELLDLINQITKNEDQITNNEDEQLLMIEAIDFLVIPPK